MKTILFCSFLALGAGFFACNNSDNDDHSDSVDSAKEINKEVKSVQADASDFAVAAANGGMMEVELGKIAQENASSPKVKAFGAMMVKDHSAADNSLQEIARALHIVLPDSVSNDTKKEIDMLKMKKGRDFDKAYIHMMLDDHEKDIAAFKKCAENCSDSTIKSFANNTLPVLEKHLDSIRLIAGKK